MEIGLSNLMMMFLYLNIIQFLLPFLAMNSYFISNIRNTNIKGSLVAQLVKCPSLDFSPVLNVRVVSSRPTLDSMLGVESI